MEKVISIWSVQHRNQVESTNKMMIQMFEENEHLHHFVISADQQSSGKGRLGHDWASPKGNSYSTYLLNFQKDDFFLKSENLSLLGFATAIAIVRTLLDFGVSKSDIFCKWPNDILVQGKKISGILLESITGGDNQLKAVMVGCGVNLNHVPKDATIHGQSLSILVNAFIDPNIYLEQYLLHLTDIILHWKQNGQDFIVKSWRDYSHKHGDKIRVRLPHEVFYGSFDHFDSNGHLVVRLNDGNLRTIYAGEVFALKA